MHRLISLAAAAMVSSATAGFTPALAQDANLIEAARVTLAGIQNESFIKNREFCGLIGRNRQDKLVITRRRKGSQDGCRPKSFFIFSDVEVLASYHTHGSHVPDNNVEVPSSYDLEADTEEGIYGFVSTPGGRFWIIEPEKNQVRLLCNVGCLPRDPRYDAASSEPLKPIYTRSELLEREGRG